MFLYPIDGLQVMCQRLYETAKGVFVRMIDGDEPDRHPYFISKRYYAAIAPMNRVVPGLIPPCNCRRESRAPADPPTPPQA
jgi:hypothetical protein